MEASSRQRWDAFVEAHPDGSFFHLSGWADVIERSLGHPTRFLYAEKAGEIRGVLPLGHIKSRLFGDSLVSTPFCVYGGVLASDEQAREQLEQAACALAISLQVDHLELRNREASDSGRPVKDLYVSFRKALHADPERNLAAIPRKQRAMVRKAMALGLNSVVDEGVDRFFPVYAESVRNLGTPVFPKRLFQVLKEVFGRSCEVLCVEQEGAVLAAAMSFFFRGEVSPYYGGGTAQARRRHANDFLYWEIMRRAVERGATLFDFGRSKRGTGSYRFKIHWGFEPTPLHYEYELIRARAVPDVNPLNPKYRLMIAAWKRLPLPLSIVLGPYLSRNLG